VGANYREARAARSKSEFTSKLGIVLQELKESDYWLELLAGSGFVSVESLSAIRSETTQLIAIFVASKKTSMNPR
jgi:four helix bundle protein